MLTTLRHITATAVIGTMARLSTVLVPFVAARVYGLGTEMDSFFLAAAVVLFWTMSVSPVLETQTMSEFADDPGGTGWGRILQVGTQFSLVAVGIGAAAALALWLAPDHLVAAVLAERTQLMLLELSPLLVASIWSSLLSGWLNVRHYFRSVALSPLFVGTSALAAILVLPADLGVHALVLGYLVGELMRFLYLLALVHGTHPGKVGLPEPGAGPRTMRRRGAFDAMTVQWLSLVLLGLNPIVDRFLAGGLGTGAVSVLALIERLALIPVGFMIWSVLPVVTAKIARAPADRRAVVFFSNRLLGILLASGTAVALALSAVHGWLLPALFASSKSAWPAYGDQAFLYLMLGLPFQLVHLLLWRVAVILDQPARAFAIVGLAAFVLNLVADLIAMRFLGLPGITLATSLTALVVAAMLWRLTYVGGHAESSERCTPAKSI